MLTDIKRRVPDFIIWALLFCTTLVLAFALAGLRGAFAQEVGTGILCNSAEDLEKQIAYLEAGADDQVKDCGVARVAYVRGPEAKVYVIKQGEARITQITVLAFMTPFGFMHIPPLEQFTVFIKKLEDS